MTKTIHYFLLAFLLTFFRLVGQSDFSLRHITVNDGLSQAQANFLMKDSKGFIWIGTQDGLNRYDGYTFKHFYHQDGDSTSLSSNYIWCLLEDSEGYIWVGTFGGKLCRYDRTKDSFKSFELKPFTQPAIAGNSVRALCEHPKGIIWIGADKGLWSFNPNQLKLEKKDFYIPEYAKEKSQTEELLNVVTICPLNKNSLLVGADKGLFKINIDNGRTTNIRYNGAVLPSTQTIIKAVEKNGFWVGTSEGLFYLNYFTEKDSINIKRDELFEKNIPSSFIHALYIDRQQTLWVGTSEGFVKYDEKDLPYNPFENKGGKIPLDITVYGLLECEPGLMWAATRDGIIAYPNIPSPFHILQPEYSALCSNALLGMAEDKNDNLWIGTREGLTRIGHFSKGQSGWEIECLTPQNISSMPYDYLIRVSNDDQGNLWACFRRNGFAQLKKDKNNKWFFEKTNVLDHELKGAGINDIHFDKEGYTWLATPGLGLIKWQQKTGDYEIFKQDSVKGSLKHGYIFSLLEDSQGRFWVATANGGLCEMDKINGTFNCHVFNDVDNESISSNMVLSIMEDSKKRIWACTAHGLNLYEGNGKFRRFYQKNGLPNNVVYGLLEDDNGFFWASTNNGISKIKYEDGKIATQNYTVSDGLAGNEFNQHSFFKTNNGHLLFGGVNGLTYFFPENIKPYPYPPKIAFTDFQLFNQSVPVGNILKKEINETEKIRLKYNENFLAFEFAALGFSQPQNNEYAYMMDGVDADWVYSGDRRYAGYPNMPSGEYVFKVKAANHDGIWNEDPKTIVIEILPPWWERWWAYGIYLFLIAAGIYAITYFREKSVREMEQAKIAEREKFRKRTARDFHDEAGNKITKISLLTEVAKRQAEGTEKLPTLLEQLENNIQELRTGMRDFIWVIDPENDNLYDMLLRIKDFANSLFEHSDIHFRMEEINGTLQEIPLNSNERRHLLLIFKEAMNNCIKYSKADEAIFLVEEKKGQVVFIFKDNGAGFDIFSVKGDGLRNMKERAGKIKGDIFIQSEKGTEIKLVLKRE